MLARAFHALTLSKEVDLYRPANDLPLSANAYVNELQVIEYQLTLYQPIAHQRVLLTKHRDSLRRILAAFEAGFEPFGPNREWYCGGVEGDLDHRHTPFRSRWQTNDRRERFKGLIPVSVQQAYIRALPIFDAIAIYSPKVEDFEMTRPLAIMNDPIMVGYVRRDKELGGGVYFKVAAWDLKRDLEGLKGLPSSGRSKAMEADEIRDPPKRW